MHTTFYFFIKEDGEIELVYACSYEKNLITDYRVKKLNGSLNFAHVKSSFPLRSKKKSFTSF